MIGIGFRLRLSRHAFQVQRLDGDRIVRVGQSVRLLMLVVMALVRYPLVYPGDPFALLAPIRGALGHMGELALLPGEPGLHVSIEAGIVGTLPVTGHVQSMRGVVQSDDAHGFHLFGRLGVALEQVETVYRPEGQCSTITDLSLQLSGILLCWRTASQPSFGSLSLLALSSNRMLPWARLVVYVFRLRCFDLYFGKPAFLSLKYRL